MDFVMCHAICYSQVDKCYECIADKPAIRRSACDVVHASQPYEMPTSMISLCQVGQGFPVALRRAPGCFTERIHHFAVVPLGAVPARNAEPDIHSLYRAVETVTED